MEFHPIRRVNSNRSSPNEFSEIKKSIEIQTSDQGTLISAIAVHSDPDQNPTRRIRCEGGLPFQGYYYSLVNDTCSVACMDAIYLGMIDIAYFAKVEGTGNWRVRIPVPPQIVAKHMDEKQLELLRKFKELYNQHDDRIMIEFFQMIPA